MPSRHALASRLQPRSLLVALLLGGLLGAAGTSQAQSLPGTPSEHRLQVQARSELSVAPDMATLEARLWERTPSVARDGSERADPGALAKARDRLESRTGELIRRLESQGIDSAAISAGSLIVRPDYIQQPGDNGEPGQALVRTQLERPISLRIDDLARLPAILDALTQAGVDALDGVTYDLKDRDAATDKALSQALDKARRKARLMAKALDIGLGQVIQIEETGAPRYSPQMMSMRSDAMESKAAPEYRPGEITLDASVSVAWEIEP
ncbi:SIMPL domain-containing protein [Halomonas sp. IOP_31]|uniref:SIMPL domain-containing protein n=1 Tax=Halomonas sp. IOP_31 TaxID=2876584 RepID=UPI001E58F7DA|nr:SIMPL domain-containing protein [Halomonas sp. IOP_31]MCD6007687.1 SIMPL domain-containing protein [Halomonas sp. IOP_31]